MNSINQASISVIKEKLVRNHDEHDPEKCWLKVSGNAEKEAAVSVLLVRENNAWSLVYIERAINDGDPHSGQVAFPGGKVEDKDEDLIATALRETEEEIGITLGKDQVLSLLPSQKSRNQYEVRPVVATCDWPQLTKLQESEVASVFTIPLSWLANDMNIDSATVLGLPKGATIVYKAYNEKRLWGLTAVITQELLNIIK